MARQQMPRFGPCNCLMLHRAVSKHICAVLGLLFATVERWHSLECSLLFPVASSSARPSHSLPTHLKQPHLMFPLKLSPSFLLSTHHRLTSSTFPPPMPETGHSFARAGQRLCH